MTTAADIFTDIYRNSRWGAEHRSGLGSTPQYTAHVMAALQNMIHRFGPATILDIPCGVGDWIRPILDSFDVAYTGADIVEDAITTNRERWPQDHWQVLDICQDNLPKSDLVFCRDCLVHLPLYQVHQALRNIKRSGSKYLAVTTFPQIPEGNGDISLGNWRRLDLTASPFNLPPPLALYNECQNSPSRPQDKSLGVWFLQDLLL